MSLAAFLVCINCTAFILAFIFYFKSSDKETSGFLKILKILGLITTAVSVAVSIWGEFRNYFSTVLLLISLIVFILALHASYKQRLGVAFTTAKPHWLINWGVYSYIRHPFYLSYTLTWLAVAISTKGWMQIFYSLLMIAMISLYVIAAKGEESFFSQSEMSDQYQAYRSRTGMFFPSLVKIFKRKSVLKHF